MEVPLRIVVRNLPHSEALETRVRESVAGLEGFHPRIVNCRVTVEEPGRHRRRGRHFQVRIDARIPGREIVVDRDEDVYVALRDAFLAVRRQIEDAARLARREVKAHAAPHRNEPAREEQR